MTADLRAATASDCRLLYEFVSRPDSIANKLNTRGGILWNEHEAWFGQRLADPGCRIWILTVNRQPVGQIRLTREAEGWEIDVYVAEEHRRHNVARSAVVKAIETLRRDVGEANLIARVLPDNAASRRLFESSGFRLLREADDHLVFSA